MEDSVEDRMIARWLGIGVWALVLSACTDGGGGGKDDTGGGGGDDGGTDVVDADGDGSPAEEDCDDANHAVNPSAAEVCDGADNNCDGAIDEGVTLTTYADVDGDGFGDASTEETSCEVAADRTEDGSDCNDADPAISPDGIEVCDEQDNNCDGSVDEGVLLTFFVDGDADGFGDPASPVQGCFAGGNLVENDQDCDDTNGAVSPLAAEVCNGIDDDCNASTTEDNMVAFTDPTGVTSDATATFSGGTSDQPLEVSLSDDGVYTFCDGTWFVSLTVSADVGIASASDDPTRTILDGAGAAPVLDVVAPSTQVNVAGVTLQNGLALDPRPSLLNYSGGGLLGCESEVDTLVTVDRAVLQGGEAGIGGALVGIGCDVRIGDTDVLDNSAAYGGAIFHVLGPLELVGSRFEGNNASQLGRTAYLGVSALFAPDEVLLRDSVVQGDPTLPGTISSYQSEMFLDGATLTCEGDGGIVGSPTGGINVVAGAAVSAGCSFGAPGGTDDNLSDVYNYEWGSVAFGSEAWFICDASIGCGPYLWDGATGTFQFRYDSDADPSVDSCVHVWDLGLTGSTALCDDCDFAFEGTATFDASASTVCSEWTSANLPVGLAVDLDGYGDGYPTATAFLNGVRFFTDGATWDGTTVEVAGGYDDYPVYGGYYYTYALEFSVTPY
jgi:hypothetical protein